MQPNDQPRPRDHSPFQAAEPPESIPGWGRRHWCADCRSGGGVSLACHLRGLPRAAVAGRVERQHGRRVPDLELRRPTGGGSGTRCRSRRSGEGSGPPCALGGTLSRPKPRSARIPWRAVVGGPRVRRVRRLHNPARLRRHRADRSRRCPVGAQRTLGPVRARHRRSALGGSPLGARHAIRAQHAVGAVPSPGALDLRRRPGR